ncbi:adenosylmethionine--8-amino-7-oxononanoate transaminase [Verrucomicrobiota bacterium]
MNTDKYRETDRDCIWHPYTKHSALQQDKFLVITRGEGIYLYDTDDHKYLDAISSWWCCNLGHSHPRIVQAITEQTQKLQHSILGNMTHPPAIELALKLTELVCPEGARVMYASDGACAVEAALKISLQYWHNTGHTKKTKFVSLKNAYHGDTLGAVSVGYMPSFHKPFEAMVLPGYQAESPCCGTCSHGKDPETCDLECFASMAKIINAHAEEIAAVIVEPLCQGAAGMRIYSSKYLKRLYEYCKEKNVLLIVDEIAMGFGRTGRMFAFEHSDIQPDIVCLGKGLSGGYLPISATVVKKEIYETFSDQPEDNTFYHGHTFCGNPIASSAALETLRIYEEENIIEQANRLGNLLEKEMSVMSGSDNVRNVRCLGMIGAVELEDAEMAKKVKSRLMNEGILIRPLGNVVYLMLPLITPENILCDAVKRLFNAIKEL